MRHEIIRSWDHIIWRLTSLMCFFQVNINVASYTGCGLFVTISILFAPYLALILILISIAEKVWNINLHKQPKGLIFLLHLNINLWCACTMNVFKSSRSPYQPYREILERWYKIRTLFKVCEKCNAFVYSQCISRIEQVAVAVTLLDSYSGDARFLSRLGYRLSGLRIFVVFLSLPRQMLA
jgi:hypothetical protein